ncbi:hypothetical protein EOM09_05670, partial [bacterium]|nr:hypothetical protein [bacterium]
VLNMLGEAATKEISTKQDPKTFNQSKNIAKKGGNVAKVAKDNLEKQLGEKIVTKKNAKEIHFVEKKQLK